MTEEELTLTNDTEKTLEIADSSKAIVKYDQLSTGH